MYAALKSEFEDQQVTLVAVSKTKPQEAIMELYDRGQRIFAENRVQELVEKQAALPKDISWHMIGALQKNKVKYLAPFIDMIHSVDSLALAKMINKEATKQQRTISILLQIKIGKEEAKSGYNEKQLWDEVAEMKAMDGIKICGVMGIGTYTDEQAVTQSEFRLLKSYFDKIKATHFKDEPYFKEISMGMSGDYQLAIREGSTMVRIGSLLFGSR